MATLRVVSAILSLSMIGSLCHAAATESAPTQHSSIQATALGEEEQKEWNNKIRRERFDIVLPEAMRKNNVDMWIYVMRETIPDPFGSEELGSTSGVFVFTDRGGGRIERAVLGRRWGASKSGGTWKVTWNTKLVEECGCYDIVHDPVVVWPPPGGVLTEYDYRFKGLREFVKARNPKRIAVNYLHDLGPWPTFTGASDFTAAQDGISHTDYVLLTEELGDEYAKRIVSDEYVLMDYLMRRGPVEIELLKKLRKDEDERVKKAFAEIVPGVTKNRDVGLTVFRWRGRGVSERGRSPGQENVVIQGGDIVAAPSQGTYAYVLRNGETEPPPEIKKLWATYKQIDKVLADSIKTGLTGREIVKSYKPKFEKAGIIVRDEELHLFAQPDDFPSYTVGYDPEKTHLAIDAHGMAKGARKEKYQNLFGPRIGSYGSEWMWDIPLPPNHFFVLEYFIYMPAPTKEDKDRYLFWWDHEQALATENGVKYLSPPQKDLYLIK